MKFLYNDNYQDDLIHILAFLDGFAEERGLNQWEVDPTAIEHIARNLKVDFPCKDGVDAASVFKKAARFVFLFTEYAPIQSALPPDVFGDDLTGIQNHQNAFIALLIALDGLYESNIYRDNGDDVVSISNRIQLSKHSLIDITEAIAKSSYVTGFYFLTVLLEQLAYKTNPDCQYDANEI